MKKLLFLLVVTLTILSCNSKGNHYHDGKYQTKLFFVEVNCEINGSEITINNSVAGISKLKCTQYPDRIEYEEKNGVTRVLTALENGDLKLNEQIIFQKIK
ncbi:hypothetical protein [Cloacibacterium sp.]|uniref:hypothetical protein n=1 Tax=Cloacibacterium sp. TaxID=1913682 RepID=UPI0039E39D8B